MAQHIHCPTCQTVIPPENINIGAFAAVCPACGHVFQFANYMSASIPQIRKDNVAISMPKGFVVRHGLSELLIDIKWKDTRRKGFFTFFTILWNAMLLPFVLIAISQGEMEIVLFISLHVATGAGLLLYTLSLWLNSTLVTVDRRGIDIRHIPIPLPFMPKRYIEARNVEQFYVEEYVPSKTNNRPDITYGLRVKTRDGKDFRIVPGFTSPDPPLYLEREMEKFLSIEDKPI